MLRDRDQVGTRDSILQTPTAGFAVSGDPYEADLNRFPVRGRRESPPMLDRKDSTTTAWQTACCTGQMMCYKPRTYSRATDSLLHCGISAPSAARFMAEMGHKPAYPSHRRADGMSAMTA